MAVAPSGKAEEGALPAPAPRWRRVVGYGVGLVILAFLVGFLAKEWRKLPPGALRPNWWLVAAAFLAIRVSNAVALTRWVFVLRALGGRLPLVRAYAIGVLSQLGRYVPGKVMILAARAYLCVREGVNTRLALMSAAYDQALLIISASVLVAVWVVAAGAEVMHAYRWLSLAVVAAGAAALHPRVVEAAARVAGRLVRREVTVQGLSYGALAWLGLGYLAAWAVAGLAFYLFVIAFQPLPFGRALDCTAIQALAMVVGLLALFVPAGLGVRDGLVAVLLSAYMPLPLATAISLALRALVTLGEVCDVAVALLLRAKLPPLAPTLEDRRPARDGG